MFIALLLVARYVELVARRRAGDAVEGVARARPATALRLAGWPADREVETVGAAALAVGDVVLVRPGGVIPADGEIVEGHASVEEAMLTGESRPRGRAAGDAVLAGSVVRDGALVMRVTAAGGETRLAAIERLVDRAAGDRPRVARVADRVATWFVGTLLVLAAATALAWWQVDPARTLAVTFAVLVVSCPCALSLATPAALAAAAGALGRAHVVVARADALETLARVTHVVLDKTGTLTTGRIALQDVIPLAGHDARRGAGARRRARGTVRASAGRRAARVGAGRRAPAGRRPAGRARHGRRRDAGRARAAPRPAGLGGRAVGPAGARRGGRRRRRPRRSSPWATPAAAGHCSRWATRCGRARRRSAARLAQLRIVPVLLSGDRAATVAAVARDARHRRRARRHAARGQARGDRARCRPAARSSRWSATASTTPRRWRRRRCR